MKKSNHIYLSSNKESRIFPIMIVCTTLACIITIILVGSFIYTSSKVNQNLTDIDNLNTEILELEKIIEEIRVKEEQYKKDINDMNQELSKYEPIVIPESMK